MGFTEIRRLRLLLLFRGKHQPLAQVTFEGDYSAGIERLATLLVNHYGSDLFPVVSVGDDLLDQFWGVKHHVGRHP